MNETLFKYFLGIVIFLLVMAGIYLMLKKVGIV